METIRVVCAHDCPDMCSLLAHVEDGRITRIYAIRNPHKLARLDEEAELSR